MPNVPCIRSNQPTPATPAGLLLIFLILLLIFVITAHLLGLSAELILLLITTVIGAAIKLVKALPRLQPPGAL
ncbi:hypothetical protein AB0G15_42865 [Streptosporangium sp. NPDC023825]|uniref:hypothetical protein n=1 Tax=Streptosporangium sp. NPDC023825 TaxID=3154909 RepID=UPI003429CCEE